MEHNFRQEKPSSTWSNHTGGIILIASQFAWYLALNKAPDLKWYYDENRIFPIEAIQKHKQVVCTRRKMLFTVLKYLFSFQRY